MQRIRDWKIWVCGKDSILFDPNFNAKSTGTLFWNPRWYYFQKNKLPWSFDSHIVETILWVISSFFLNHIGLSTKNEIEKTTRNSLNMMIPRLNQAVGHLEYKKTSSTNYVESCLQCYPKWVHPVCKHLVDFLLLKTRSKKSHNYLVKVLRLLRKINKIKNIML